MQIAIDCRMSGKSGIGSYFDALLPYFIKDFECLLIGSGSVIEKYKSCAGVTVCECTAEPFSVQELFFFPKNVLKKINECGAFYTPYCNIPGGIRVPVYTTIHDIVFLDVPGLASKAGTFVRKCFYRRAARKSAAVFTVSNFSAERIKTLLHCKEPVVVTYNAAPEYLSSRTDGTEIIRKEKHSVLFVGNIKKHKGLKVLLDAFRLLLKKVPDSRLIIVGNAENFRTGDTAIFEEIKTLPPSAVCFTGKISNEELKNCYYKANLLVQPSFYEGFGMPPLEALTCGTNAVISDIPVFREIYRDFPVTFFSSRNADDLAEKIEKSFEHPEVRDIPKIYSFSKTFETIKKELI